MSQGVKILLLVLGLCFVGMIGLIAAGYYWVDSNKDRLKESVVEAADEAKTFAQGTDQRGCEREAERLGEACGAFDPVCEARLLFFYRVCLDNAAPSAGFCEGVPAESDIVSSTKWAVEACGVGDAMTKNRCSRLHQAKQAFCNEG